MDPGFKAPIVSPEPESRVIQLQLQLQLQMKLQLQVNLSSTATAIAIEKPPTDIPLPKHALYYQKTETAIKNSDRTRKHRRKINTEINHRNAAGTPTAPHRRAETARKAGRQRRPGEQTSIRNTEMPSRITNTDESRPELREKPTEEHRSEICNSKYADTHH